MGMGGMEELRQIKKIQYLKLVEFIDISKQLNEAVKRKDDVSVNLLLAMREEPLTQMYGMEERIETLVQTLPQEEAIRVGEILSIVSHEGTDQQGEGAAGLGMTPSEAGLYEQAASVFRLLQRAAGLDKSISEGICGRRSFYQKYR